MITIKTVEELEKVCNEFLATITERKNNAIEVRHRGKSVFKRYDFKRFDTYFLKYSKEKEYGFRTDLELLTDIGEIIYIDSVDFMYNHKRSMFFWLNNTNFFAVKSDLLKIEFNGYRYSSVDRKSDDHDYLAKRGIMIDLKLKLEELFK